MRRRLLYFLERRGFGILLLDRIFYIRFGFFLFLNINLNLFVLDVRFSSKFFFLFVGGLKFMVFVVFSLLKRVELRSKKKFFRRYFM